MRRAALMLLFVSTATAAPAQVVPALNSKPTASAKTDSIPAAHDGAASDRSTISRALFSACATATMASSSIRSMMSSRR